MKAWFVWADEEWGDFVHGETASKAKSMFCRSWDMETEWIYLRPIREPELDNIPITTENISTMQGHDVKWYPICKCTICKDFMEA